jgi:3-octaprenyl-4-hydroxybenzoate carboxy-lyase
MNRCVIVVDDDVDPMNLEEVVWAMMTRCEPSEDIEIMRKSWGSNVDSLLADPTAPYNSRLLIDACRPFEKLDTFPRVAQSTPAQVRQTVAKWKDLFADPRFPLPETMIPSAAVGGPGSGRGITSHGSQGLIGPTPAGMRWPASELSGRVRDAVERLALRRSSPSQPRVQVIARQRRSQRYAGCLTNFRAPDVTETSGGGDISRSHCIQLVISCLFLHQNKKARSSLAAMK